MDEIKKDQRQSLWLKDAHNLGLSSLKSNVQCDVCIIGAGITGITAAYLLSEMGMDMVLIDGHSPMALSSGNTTAKFTFQHGVIYHEIIENYGLEKAQLYYDAQVQGMDKVKALIKDLDIPCDFKETYAMVYAEDEDGFNDLVKEYEAYHKLGIKASLSREIPYGLPGVGSLRVENQIQLHPVKYMAFLLKKLRERHVKIYEKAKAMDILESDQGHKVMVENGQEIYCQKVIMATGYPFFDGKGLYFTRLSAYRSYLVAFPISKEANQGGMLITNKTSPYSIRFAQSENEHYVLIGGQGGKVGQEESTIQSYANLIQYGKDHFPVDQIKYSWSAQDYQTVDKIPYVGALTSNHSHIFVATGFNKWGMTNGVFAAMLLKQILLGEESKFKELFSPSRGEVKENLGETLKQNLNVAKEMITGKVKSATKEISEIGADEGGVIKYNGKKTGVYRGFDRKLHLVDNTCTHLGCELAYNEAERSFDCPCHGSRFNYDGKVIEGPALEDLKRIEE